MPRRLTRNIVLSVITNERMGFEFGKPQRLGEDATSVLVPIKRKTSLSRHYKTLPELREGVLEMIDSGSVQMLQVLNKSKENVFIRAGTIFDGDTQERASVRSAVVFPGAKAEVEVRCVHASRGVNRGSGMKYAGITPLHLDVRNYRRGFVPEGQSAYWSNVTSYSMTCSSAATGSLNLGRVNLSSDLVSSEVAVPTGVKLDDLKTTHAKFSTDIDAVLKKARLLKNQAGMALINEHGCRTVECFDLSMSWKALHEDAVKRVGSECAGKDDQGVFEYHPERAKKLVQDVLSAGYETNLIFDHKPSNGEPSVTITGLSRPDWTGEVVEIDGSVVHLMLNRIEG